MPGSRGRGRPSALTPETADRLVALVAAGTTLTDAARVLGVVPRTVTNWRRRAWSREPRDGPYIDLEKRLLAALATRRTPPSAPASVDWQKVAAELEAAYPERWAIGEP